MAQSEETPKVRVSGVYFNQRKPAQRALDAQAHSFVVTRVTATGKVAEVHTFAGRERAEAERARIIEEGS